MGMPRSLGYPDCLTQLAQKELQHSTPVQEIREAVPPEAGRLPATVAATAKII